MLPHGGIEGVSGSRDEVPVRQWGRRHRRLSAIGEMAGKKGYSYAKRKDKM